MRVAGGAAPTRQRASGPGPRRFGGRHPDDLLTRCSKPSPRLSGELRLLLAVIGRACRNVRLGNGHAEDACAFLAGPVFDAYAARLGLCPAALRWQLRASGKLPARDPRR